MVEIQYQDKTYKAKTEEELFRVLRNENKLTLKEIGNLVGKSKQRVSKIIGPVGRLEFPELKELSTFIGSDEMVSLKLGIPVSRVAAARRQLGLKSKVKIDVYKRRKRLARYLFSYPPGPEFVPFIKEQLNHLTDGKAKVLEDFYILGVSQSLADNVNTDSDRIYRHLAKKELKEVVLQYNLDDLKKEGVISNG